MAARIDAGKHPVAEPARLHAEGAAAPGEELGEEDLRALKRQAFVELARDPLTLARIRHMLATGKPLRT